MEKQPILKQTSPFIEWLVGRFNHRFVSAFLAFVTRISPETRLKVLLEKRMRQLYTESAIFVEPQKPKHVYVSRAELRQLPKRNTDNEQFYTIADPVKATGRVMLGYDRLYMLWQAVVNTHRLKLPAVEVGAYKGGSAFFLASAFKSLIGEELSFHVFDTFSGHPDNIDENFDPYHEVGMFDDTSYESVKAYLAPFEKLQFHVGDASQTILQLPEMTYGFAHLDVDIYRPMLDCLEYFWARLAMGGVIVVDDYDAPKCPGVNQAVAEFLINRTDCQTWRADTEQLVLVKIA